jgi:hypothetical protein
MTTVFSFHGEKKKKIRKEKRRKNLRDSYGTPLPAE